MKKKIFSIFFALVLVVSFSLMAAVPVAAEPEATLTIGDISVVAGGTVTVPIVAYDIDSSYEVMQAAIELKYDPSVVIVNGVATGDGPPVIDWSTGEPGSNWLGIMAFDFANTYEGDIIIAYVTFKAVGSPGDSCALQFGDWDAPFTGTGLANFSGVEVPLTLVHGTFTVEKIYEVWVDDGWTEGDCGEHEWGVDAFATIQGGINGVSPSGIVIVAAGTYYGEVIIDKSLTLEGAQAGVDARTRSGDESVIDGGSTTANYYLVQIKADNVIFDGFTVTHPQFTGSADASGILTHIGGPWSNMRITNCIIHDIGAPTRTSVAFGAFAINSGPVDGLEIDHNLMYNITHNDPTSAWNNAIIVWGGGGLLASDINIHDNKMYDIEGPASPATCGKLYDGGIFISSDCANVVIDNNEFTNCGEYGISDNIGTGSAVTITKNEISGATVAGIRCMEKADTITGNTISGCDTGIQVREEADAAPTITGNIFQDNDIQVLDDAELLVIEDVLAPNNTFDRAVVVDRKGASLLHTIWSYIQDGIDNADDGDTVNVAAGTYVEDVLIAVERMTLASTEIHGANIKGSLRIEADDVSVRGFKFTDPTPYWGEVHSIFIHEGAKDVLIEGNLIDGFGTNNPPTVKVNGICLNTYGNPVLVSADVIGNHIVNVHMGIYAQGETNLVAIGNTIEESTHCGIGIDSDAGTEIYGNTISNSGDMGIEVFRENVVAALNNITGNAVGVVSFGPQVDAPYNWWGNPNGSGAIAFDIYPIGDAVSGDVDYSPWLPGEWEDYFDPVAEDFIDSDGDGFSDLKEYWLGTDPDDDTDFPGAAIGEVDTAYVAGDDQATLQDSEGTIADVDISGAPEDASGTITGARYTDELEPIKSSLSVGTGTTGVVFLDIHVTGYDSGWAHITVPYLDEEPPEVDGKPTGDGIVDGTDILEHTLSLYYWDGAWRLADNNRVDHLNNNVSGDIPIDALTGTPVGGGGYEVDEALVAIESILNLSKSGEDTVELTIVTNTASLSAATIYLTFDPTVVEVLGVEEVEVGGKLVATSDFDTLTVNSEYGFIGNDTQIACFVVHQSGADGVNATGDGALVAVVKLQAADNSSTMDFSSLHLEVDTLKDNKGDRIPCTFWIPSFAIVGGVGDANRDTYVDIADVVAIERAIAGFIGHSKDPLTMNVDARDDVDAYDCTYLARHFIDLDYPLPPDGWMPPWGSWPPWPPAPPGGGGGSPKPAP